MFSGLISALVLAGSLLTTVAVLPSTTNYELNSYGFGSGGTANSSTSNYSLEGISGELGGQTATTATYQTLPGYIQTQQANVPKVTLSNPSNWYDKLKFVIDNQSNPSDALFALQICVGSDWISGSCGGTTLYVKSDDTLGTILNTTDYQTYSTWGSGSGSTIIGLSPSTTYYIRAKATQGQFTESGYGPSSSAATSAQQISFCLYNDYSSGCGSGNSIAFSGLVAGTPTSSPTNLGVDFATNANSGGNVYIYDQNGGLVSARAPSYPIPSATANLSTAAQGYGGQVASTTQTSGGPLTKLSPYDLSGNNIGQISTTVNTILTSSGPLVAGRAAIQLQAKASNTTPAVNDYADTVTIIAAASF